MNGKIVRNPQTGGWLHALATSIHKTAKMMMLMNGIRQNKNQYIGLPAIWVNKTVFRMGIKAHQRVLPCRYYDLN